MIVNAWQLRDAFGCTVHCVRSGLHELDGRGPVEAFDFGDELPGGVIAHEVDVICPDETALYIPAHRALACADGVVRFPDSDELRFVPDELMDDPEETKAGLRDAYRRLLDLDFDHLLLAHGDPVVTPAKKPCARSPLREGSSEGPKRSHLGRRLNQAVPRLVLPCDAKPFSPCWSSSAR